MCAIVDSSRAAYMTSLAKVYNIERGRMRYRDPLFVGNPGLDNLQHAAMRGAKPIKDSAKEGA